MKHITILLPTRNRIEKLKRTLTSIPRLDYIDVWVICDHDKTTVEFIRKLNDEQIKAFPVVPGVQTFNYGSVFCKNAFTRKVSDGLLYATDDIIFQENAIQNAFECFNRNFLDDDGVVGFVQIGNAFHPTGVGLVGQKFLQRFPNKMLFYPGYFHFACQEIYDLCLKLGGKFVQEKQAVILHKHPCNYKEELDQTHLDARLFKNEDHKLMEERKKKGLIWGDSKEHG